MSASPLPMRKTSQPQHADLSFGDAVEQAATTGRKFRRKEWPEDHYGYFRADVLHIHRTAPGVDGTDHRWIVGTGDVLGTDWEIV